LFRRSRYLEAFPKKMFFILVVGRLSLFGIGR
jgi:hypothetical protein